MSILWLIVGIIVLMFGIGVYNVHKEHQIHQHLKMKVMYGMTGEERNE